MTRHRSWGSARASRSTIPRAQGVASASSEPLERRVLLSADALKAAPLGGGDMAIMDWNGHDAAVKAGQWIIQLDAVAAKPGENLKAVSDLIRTRRADVNVLDRIGNTDLALIESPIGVGFDELKRSLSRLRGFASLQPNFVYSVDAIPNDARFNELYGMHNTGQSGGVVDADIDAPEAWDISTGSSSVIVGVIDTGVAYDHPDLAANMWTNPGEIAGNLIDDDLNGYVDDVHGYDFVGANDSNPYDEHGHGTHCAGTIAGVGNNGIGVAGVSHNARIMALRFLDTNGDGTTADAVEAVNYATMMKSRGFNIPLTSNSWGGGGFDAALQNAIAAAGAANMLFVAAAGNDGSNNDGAPHYPSNYNLDNVIAVASTDRFDQRSGFSNYGPTTVDIGAPGSNILSTVLTTSNNIWDPSGYGSISGTSMATPHVAGAAALGWSVAPTATYQQIRDAIYAGGDAIASMAGITATGKRLNAHKMLKVLTAAGPAVVAQRPTGNVSQAISSVQFDFSRTMNQGSFALSDVNSFTAPGGGSLTSALTGFTWVDADTLQINFNPQSTPGTYNIDIGPAILSAAGHAMDQNTNGVAGEVADRYAGSFTYVEPIIYTSASTAFENLNLVAGAADVVTTLNGVDDGTASISLGASSFRFYNQVFTTLFVSSNGLITFGSANSDYINADLTSAPTQLTIAPLWDDWRTDTGTAPTDSAVLHRFDTANNRLIIEWSDIPNYNAIGTDPVTFQAILQLNTGGANGPIVFNYVDLGTGDANYNNGVAATVGIKDAGVQGANRLLISHNAANALVGSGTAIRLSQGQPIGIWTGLGNGVTFEDPANWSNNTVPSVGDDCVINVASGNPTITISSPRSVRSITSHEAMTIAGSLTIAAASQFNASVTLSSMLGGAGSGTFASTLTWTAGTMSGTGKVFIPAGATLNINAGTGKLINRTIENRSGGLINWNASTTGGATGSVVNKSGATVNLNSATGGTVTHSSAAASSLINEAGATLNKTGDGTFTLLGGFNNAGLFDVQGGLVNHSGAGTHAGQFNLASTALLRLHTTGKTFTSTSSVGGPGTLSVASGTHTAAGTIDVGAVAVSGGALHFSGGLLKTSALSLMTGGVVKLTAVGSSVLRTGTMSIDSASKLDLADNDLIVDYSGATVLDNVVSLIALGFNGGDWAGNGITSSAAALDPAVYALGVADNASLPLPFGTVLSGPLFAGQDVDETTVLVKFTWAGDLTLDGALDFQDLSLFNGSYDAGATTSRLWVDGDLNFDGLLDFQDLSLFNGNYDPFRSVL